jgi:hypothetical protein
MAAEPDHPGDLVMTTSASARPFTVRRLSKHEIVIARLAVAHDNGAHVSPHLACFKCLHGAAPAFLAARKAA